MPFFSATNPYDEKVDRATSEKNVGENWQRIMEICDDVSRGDAAAARYALKSISRRLQDRNAWIQLQALTLLGACVQNSGREFRLAVCTRDFCDLIKRMATSKNLQAKVSTKLRSLLVEWQKEFGTDAQLDLIRGTVEELSKEGVDFTDVADGTTTTTQPTTTTPSFVSSTPAAPAASRTNDAALALAEEEELAAAIRESLKLSQGETQSSLYPAISPPMVKKKQRVKVVYAFEAKEDNELSLELGQFVSVIDDSDENWWSGVDDDGHKGYFPASFVTTDLSYQPPVEEDPVDEPEEVEPQPIVLDEQLIDHLLGLLVNAKPGDDPHSAEQQEIAKAEAAVKDMIPLIENALTDIEGAHSELSEVNTKYSDALSLYERLVKYAPPPPQPQHYGPPAGLQGGWAQPHHQPQPHYGQQHAYPPGPGAPAPHAPQYGTPPGAGIHGPPAGYHPHQQPPPQQHPQPGYHPQHQHPAQPQW
eukprot:m.21100 g.21100  ORF g.21100 m.21100 type:complete len:476 (-) comp6333_c0_seq1:194-1621(-)